MSAARGLLPLTLLLLVAAAGRAEAQEKIKMCGRELIRVALSSCGNSRLRRSLLDVDPDPHRWALDVSSMASHSSSREEEEEDEEEGVFSTAPHWYPLTPRIRRAAGKISDICCETGCSVKELTQFC